MEKCKIYNKLEQELGTIIIFPVLKHKVGIIFLIPYMTEVIQEAYKPDVKSDIIIADLLSKAELNDVIKRCN